MKFLRRLFAEIKIRYMPEVTTCIVYIFLLIICWLIIHLADYPLTGTNWQSHLFGGW